MNSHSPWDFSSLPRPRTLENRSDMADIPTRPGKLMAANRGEIAIRIFRAANELGLRTVSIFAEEDRFSIHRFKADEAYQLDSSKGPVGAYLDVEGIVALAKQKGVTMIHPGYGFLSENASFARACAREGIIFIGPSPELLENMGDKTAARTLAHKFKVPTLPGTEEPITDPDQALTVAHDIGFPLIIKAAFGGGGRGMRVVEKPSQLPALLAEAQNEALNAFGNPAVFLERYISRAKHIEVQILGDQHGNVVHLYERDCSVQRRYQKVVEVAPAMHLDPKVRKELCDAAVKLAKGIGYNNAGTVEFLYDMDQNDWFFIEMNPRIQVEHTVTECVTGIDLVRSQILVAQGNPLFGEEVAIPPQDEIPCNGFAIQCRVTTEDPLKNFSPDYGRILNYRSAAGFGIRLDAASGDAGSVVTPYYDSMLVKITAMGRDFPMACQRMDRALREFRIRGVKTNIPFLENVIADETFRAGQAHTKLIDTKTELFQFRPRRDRATRTLSYISDITLNGNPTAKGWKPAAALPKAHVPDSLVIEHHAEVPKGTRDFLLELGPEKFAKWILDENRLLITDTTLRDAHQSLIATRMRTYDMLRVAEAVAHRVPQLFSLEMWGGATFDTAMRFLSRVSVGPPSPVARKDPESLLPDAVPRLERGRLLELSGQRRRRFRETRGGLRHGHLPDLRFAQLPAQHAGRHGSRARSRQGALRSRHLLYRRHQRRETRQVFAEILHRESEGSREDGRAHPRHQGHGRPLQTARRPQARHRAQAGNRHPHPFPHPRHLRPQRRLRARRLQRRRGHRGPRHRLDVRLHLAAEPQLGCPPRSPKPSAIRASISIRSTNSPIIGKRSSVSTNPSTPRRAPAPPKSMNTKCPAANTPTSASRPTPWASATAGAKSPAPMPR